MSSTKTFRDVVEADLRRAARLIISSQAEQLDPQWRIATPSGDWSLAVTLPADEHGREEVMKAIATFCGWKDAFGFTMVAELEDPAGTIISVGVSRTERYACAVRVDRAHLPLTANSFSEIEWLPLSAIDASLLAILPAASVALTPGAVSSMVRLFGREGRWPAVNLRTGEIGA